MVAVQTVQGFEGVSDLIDGGEFFGVPGEFFERSAAIGAAVSFLLCVEDVGAEEAGLAAVRDEGEAGVASRTEGFGEFVSGGVFALSDNEGDFGWGERPEIGCREGEIVLADGALQGDGGAGLGGWIGFLGRGCGGLRPALIADREPCGDEHGKRADGGEENGNSGDPILHTNVELSAVGVEIGGNPGDPILHTVVELSAVGVEIGGNNGEPIVHAVVELSAHGFETGGSGGDQIGHGEAGGLSGVRRGLIRD